MRDLMRNLVRFFEAFLRFQTPGFHTGKFHRGPLQISQPKAVLCFFQSFCDEGPGCSLSDWHACRGPDVYPRDTSLACGTKGSTRMCSVLELGHSILCMLRRETLRAYLEDRNLLKLRSLDSSRPFFVSDNNIWGQ